MKKSEVYYKEVYEKCSSLQRRSLNNVKTVCDDLEKKNLKIRILVVGRECVKRFNSTSYNTIKANKALTKYLYLRVEEQVFEEIELSGDYGELLEQCEFLKMENSKLRELIKGIKLNYFLE